MNGEISKIVLEDKTDKDLPTVEVRNRDSKNSKGKVTKGDRKDFISRRPPKYRSDISE